MLGIIINIFSDLLLEQGQDHGVGNRILIKRNKYVIQNCDLFDQVYSKLRIIVSNILFSLFHSELSEFQ